MEIESDPKKRQQTLIHRELDMADAGILFERPHITVEDDRADYGEPRFLTVGYLNGRMIFLAWTYRGPNRRIISMRKTNAREQRKYAPLLER